MKLLKIALAATALALAAPAFAADLPAKAPPPLASLFNTTYPYQTSGLFFGVYTEGGGGSVNGTVAGVSSAKSYRDVCRCRWHGRLCVGPKKQSCRVVG